MQEKVFVYDQTSTDKLSSVRGIGRYLQILKESFGESWIFTDNIKRISADSVFINPFFNFLQSPLTLRRVAKRQIAVIHDLIPLKYPSHFPTGIKGSIYILLNKIALRNYGLIITDSKASKKDIVDILKINEEKIKVIYPCLPKIFVNSKSKTLNPKQYQNSKSQISTNFNQFQLISTNFCLYVGDATWNKNLVNIAKAIKIANVSCVFVGKVFESFSFSHSWQKELKEFYKLTKDDKRFIFKGFVSDKELIKLYQQAVINILPSRDEGFGFSYLEAASQYCPSVLADIPVLKEISDKNALFAEPGKPDKIANAIGELFFNNAKREQIGELAFERSLFFSQKNFKDQLSKIIGL